MNWGAEAVRGRRSMCRNVPRVCVSASRQKKAVSWQRPGQMRTLLLACLVVWTRRAASSPSRGINEGPTQVMEQRGAARTWVKLLNARTSPPAPPAAPPTLVLAPCTRWGRH